MSIVPIFLKKTDLIRDYNFKISHIKPCSSNNESIYRFIRFFGRVPPYILDDIFTGLKNKLNNDKLVFDPFGGSGSTIFFAIKNGFKNIIYNDLNPVFVFITKTIFESLFIDEEKLVGTIKSFEQRLLENVVINKLINLNGLYINKVIYQKEPNGTRIKSIVFEHSREKIETTNYSLIKIFIKNVEKNLDCINKDVFSFRFYYKDGRKFIKTCSDIDSLGDLFCDWSKIILSQIWSEIEKIDEKRARNFLKVCFLASLYDSSLMQMPYKSGWIIKGFWIPKLIGVKNPVSVFIKKMNYFYRHVYKKYTDKVKHAKVSFYNFDILSFDKDLNADLVITHPPYFSTIQYGELSTFWSPWLKYDIPFEKEIIQNKNQGKDRNKYINILELSLKKIIELANDESHIILIFQTKKYNEWKLLFEMLSRLNIKPIELRIYERVGCWYSRHLFNIDKYDYVFIFKK